MTDEDGSGSAGPPPAEVRDRLEIRLEDLPPEGAPAAGRRLRVLAPIDPVDAGRLRATKERMTIGRAPDSDLVLDHPAVARRHAVIRLGRGGATIEDVSDSTGVRVNGERRRRAPLSAGDELAIGPFR